MIVVTVELRSAVTRQTSLLGKMIIANDGKDTDSPVLGSYDVKIGNMGRNEALHHIWDNPWKVGRVVAHERSKNFWELLKEALNQTF